MSPFALSDRERQPIGGALPPHDTGVHRAQLDDVMAAGVRSNSNKLYTFQENI